MFSLRRKKSAAAIPTELPTTPSLPELNSQGIPWPESLVDVSSIRQDDAQKTPRSGAAKTSIHVDRSPIPFHKPFRPANEQGENGGAISALYMSNGPATFSPKGKVAKPTRASQRRTRLPPTFNLMVVGGQGTGKTSLLRLLLETADVSPGASIDQRAAVDRFLRGKPRSTPSIQTACVEICESRYDRVLLSVIDTPGLDYTEGRELRLERQVSSIMKYVDTQYADTMSEESKVIRQSKGDQHIHLCIYLIDPSAIISVIDRRAQSALPTKTRSETTVSYRNNPPDLIPDTSSGDDSEDEDSTLTMSPAEIRVIRRLSTRVNVLPVVAKADSLTDEKMTAVKEAVRSSLAEAGLNFGVFDEGSSGMSQGRKQSVSGAVGGNGVNGKEAVEEESSEGESEGDEEERQSRPVIKLRPARHPRNLSRSRSRRDLTRAASDAHRPISPDADSVANIRFSAHIVAKPDLGSLMPFALITPETTSRSRRYPPDELKTEPSSPNTQSEDGHVPPSAPDGLPTPASARSSRAFLDRPPDDLRGVFVRKFRWGTVDVLNPDHCDFAALRTAVLSTHLRVLKTQTKEVLYEKYRTEKLLARRATHNISEEERRRLLEDLGL
ncbi:hypothetical protein D9758_002737 [Tetrapyrgos nigripes]|uniref:Septin-type G domain-containing protein n=1 Tax=Tetrapyrgos nigripes TaxID=182062 RepID=A0A8H5GQN7_9AGAR|nr:hypothetical protein D9758_002737 [Tetrapyrgos nigripes]